MESAANSTNCNCQAQNAASHKSSETAPITSAARPIQIKNTPGAMSSAARSTKATIHQLHGPSSVASCCNIVISPTKNRMDYQGS